MNPEEALELVEGFQKCTLPKARWTHTAHIVVGLYHICAYDDVHKATRLFKERLIKYNLSIGVLNGYHETLTIWWMAQLQKFWDEHHGNFGQLADLLLEDPDLTRSSYPKDFYETDVLNSEEARRTYIPPRD